MTEGQELYERWRERLSYDGVDADEWHSLDAETKRAWNAVALYAAGRYRNTQETYDFGEEYER